MTQRFGSNIKSALFMETPVQVRRDDKHHSYKLNQESFILKGHDTNQIKPNTYEPVAGEDDVFIIENGDDSFTLHRKPLKDTLLQLKSQSNVPVRNLAPEYSESFKSVVEALRLLYGSQALYDIVLTDIRDIFNDVKDVRPGTVAAYFIGCFNDDKFPGPLGCSPKCAASLPPAEGTAGYSTCDDLVLIYSEGLFSSLNEKRSSHSYIYVSDVDFKGFSSENIKQLRSAGIENVTLVFGNSNDGSYREVTSVLTLDQLPQRADTANSEVTNDNDGQNTNTNNNNGAGIVFVIVIIVIIILLLVILYRTHYV